MNETSTVRGYELSRANGVVVIATLESENIKTGDMVQIWIMRDDIEPHEAVRLGLDDRICGTCPARGGNGCYVTVFQGPLSVWRAWKRGSYPILRATQYGSVFGGRMVRFGAYGDPAFMPRIVLMRVARFAAGWTGYTHQWQWQSSASWLKGLLMASCDTEAEAEMARSQGWRVFRVRKAEESLMAGEIVCPASDEGGNRTQCVRCGLCDGSRGSDDARKHIAIIAHGARAAKFHASPFRILQQ